MSSDQMETEQLAQSTRTGDFQQQLEALEKCGFKNLRYNSKLLKNTGGNFQVVKAFLEAEETASQLFQKDEKKKRRSQESTSSSSEEENPAKKEKREKKEQKKKEKELKKLERKEKKERRDSNVLNAAIIDLSGGSWPTEGSNLYLDGNNMLFVLGPIRKLALHGKRSHAESVIQQLADEFAKKMGLSRCTLIYDTTKKNVVTSSFVVCSARPRFATSDDALVEWASQPGGKGLYVTSDRELIQRLTAVGSIICKPKQWFAYVAQVLSEGQVDNMDAWIQTWMEKHELTSVTNNNA